MSVLTARFDLPLAVKAPAVARQALESVLVGWGFDDQQWIGWALVVVSELVSNAVRHGGGCVAIDVSSHGRRVVIGAADGSAVVPRLRQVDDSGGRGLRMIEALTARWGVDDHEGGKRVWVELRPYPSG
jgi:anti-sigma regulatory factor (Ser/Thr protein kinase)